MDWHGLTALQCLDQSDVWLSGGHWLLLVNCSAIVTQITKRYNSRLTHWQSSDLELMFVWRRSIHAECIVFSPLTYWPRILALSTRIQLTQWQHAGASVTGCHCSLWRPVRPIVTYRLVTQWLPPDFSALIAAHASAAGGWGVIWTEYHLSNTWCIGFSLRRRVFVYLSIHFSEIIVCVYLNKNFTEGKMKKKIWQ